MFRRNSLGFLKGGSGIYFQEFPSPKHEEGGEGFGVEFSFVASEK